MVTEESDIITQGEVEPTLQPHQQQSKIPIASSIRGQSSIYSRTLDEFQHSLTEKGRNFGSMNMDEFLNSIWTAEENKATITQPKPNPLQESNASTGKVASKQPNIPRQGSLTIPEPLCQKTVNEVWSNIHKDQHQQIHDSTRGNNNPNTTQRQPTFGEMTLEDFLVKAGIVREQIPPSVQPQQQHQQHCGVYPNHAMESKFVGQPINGGDANVTTYQQRGVRYVPPPPPPPPPPPVAVYGGGRIGNGGGGGGGGGYVQVQGLGMRSPVSPVSSDRLCANQVDHTNQYSGDVSGVKGGRRKTVDGSVEKVVERRQRRMIKNRESAARSRARKQAYTVELEAELKQLKEENTHLKEALAKLERKRKQQYLEEARMKVQAQTKAQKTSEKLRALRRSLSCPY